MTPQVTIRWRHRWAWPQDLRIIRVGIVFAGGVRIGTGPWIGSELKTLSSIAIGANRTTTPTKSSLCQSTELLKVPKMSLDTSRNDTKFYLVWVLRIDPYVAADDRVQPTSSLEWKASWRKDMGAKRANYRQPIVIIMNQSAGNMKGAQS